MASLYADEQFPLPVVKLLRTLRIDEAIVSEQTLQGKLIRVVRPSR